MNAVRARGLERRHTPFDGLLHGWRARNAAADLVGQLLQIGFERRGFLGFGHYSIGRVLGEGWLQRKMERRKTNSRARRIRRN